MNHEDFSASDSPSALSAATPPPSGLLGWLHMWFFLEDPVGRKAYAVTGLGLMLVKYMIEAAFVMVITGQVYSPLDFVNPLLSARGEYLQGFSPGFGLAWIMWTLPFLWIAVSMSIRRALDAGISPWHGFWVLVPLVNLVVMPLLACLPSRRVPETSPGALRAESPSHFSGTLGSALATVGGIAVGALYSMVVVQGMTTIFHDYGATLFFGTPFVTGVAAGYLFNLRESRSYAATIGVAFAAVVFSGVGLLLFAVEGAICLVMAAPIMVPIGIAGGPIGKALADRRRRLHRGLVGAMLVVPLVGSIEAQLPRGPELMVESAVDIAVPPEAVWQQVIAFPEIDERPEWYFRLGIACPTGARIDGRGVGATRECEFTTGRFVEPITAWEPPQRLAFDVRQQPEPMFELTPYRDLHPPHLAGAFRSTRGEFRLIALADGNTRLVGRTWYTLDIRPLDYWSLWTDWIIHRIHMRVLRHIERLAEGKEIRT